MQERDDFTVALGEIQEVHALALKYLQDETAEGMASTETTLDFLEVGLQFVE